jgi:N-acyl-D-amino-acid deacylase
MRQIVRNQQGHKPMNRRQFLAKAGAGAVGFAAWPQGRLAALANPKVPIAPAFDGVLEGFMQARQIPGGALAVVKDRRLVYARGYGWADREKQEPARADSLFRIASISKPFTAAAVLKLVVGGRLSMEAGAFDLLRLEPPQGRHADPRLGKITVRHLLHHTGGWDRDKSGDPMFMSAKIARATDTPEPASQQAIIRYMSGQPLDWGPGEHFAYSNFGYCVLGRIIEKVSGVEYGPFIRQTILAPIGIDRMRLGGSLESGRAPGEVKYYMRDGGRTRSVFPAIGGTVPAPYGGFCLEAMDSHGGWLASAVDLMRFAAALEDPQRQNWLPTPARRLFYETPAPPVGREPGGSMKPTYYGCGWQVRPARGQDKANCWHNGSLPGTYTLLVRRWDGLAWAVLFNQRSSDPKLPDGEIDGALHRAADSVAEWPGHDLF